MLAAATKRDLFVEVCSQRWEVPVFLCPIGVIGLCDQDGHGDFTPAIVTMEVQPATVEKILRHSSITVTTETYVEVIEAVQRDALGSMGSLFGTSGVDETG